MKMATKTRDELIVGAVKYISKMNPGDIISHEEFRLLVGIEFPNINDYKSNEMYIQDLDNIRLRLLSYTDEIKYKLLTTKKKSFVNVTGKGYMIQTPSAQVKDATHGLKNDIKKAVKKANALCKHVQSDKLTIKEKQSINDTYAKTGAISAIMRKRK